MFYCHFTKGDIFGDFLSGGVCFLAHLSPSKVGSTLIMALQFNTHKSVQKLFHNLHIIFSNSLMGFKVICQVEK